MGGFLYLENEGDPDDLGAVVSPYADPLKTLIRNGSLRRITEEHIADKSKGDFILSLLCSSLSALCSLLFSSLL